MSKCFKCPLNTESNINNMPGHGDVNAPILILGESPGYNEEKEGVPFIGRAGHLLHEILEKAGLSRDDCYIVNVLGCRPKSKKADYPYVDCCMDNVKKKIEGLNPKVIISLGNYAFYASTGIEGGITKKHGLQESWSEFPDVPLISTIHPAAILRDQKLYGKALDDFNSAAVYVNGEREAEDTDYKVIFPDDIQWIEEQLDSTKIVSVDLETSGFSWITSEVLAIGFSPKPRTGYVVPLLGKHCCQTWNEEDTKTIMDGLERIFSNEYTWIGANIKFDMRFLKHKFGFELKGRILDTSLLHHLVHEDEPHSLDFATKKYTNMTPYKDDFTDKIPRNEKKFGFSTVDPDLLWSYLARDVDATSRVGREMYRQVALEGLDKFYWKFTEPLIRVFLEAELRGVLIDTDRLEEAYEMTVQENLELESVIKERMEDPDINIRSTSQLSKELFSDMGLPVISKTPKGVPQVTSDVLTELLSRTKKDSIEHLMIVDLKAFKKKEKELSFLGDDTTGLYQFLDSNNRVHPIARINGATTGRVTYGDPTLQNMPDTEFMRGLIFAPPGYKIIAADYSQAELWVAAYYSNDEVFKEAVSEDLHDVVARTVLNSPTHWDEKKKREVADPEYRRRAKKVNFGIAYGMTEFGLSDELKCSVQEAKDIIRNYFLEFRKYSQWINETRMYCLQNTYVENCFGRRRHFDFPDNANMKMPQVREMLRQAVNARVQGSTSDKLHFSLIDIDNRFKNMDANVLFTHHDAILAEVSDDCVEEAKEIILSEMKKPIKELDGLVLNPDVEVDQRWVGKKAD